MAGERATLSCEASSFNLVTALRFARSELTRLQKHSTDCLGHVTRSKATTDHIITDKLSFLRLWIFIRSAYFERAIELLSFLGRFSFFPSFLPSFLCAHCDCASFSLKENRHPLHYPELGLRTLSANPFRSLNKRAMAL